MNDPKANPKKYKKTAQKREEFSPDVCTGSLRSVCESDAETIAEIYRYYVENTSITFETVPPTAEEMRLRIGKYTKKYPWIVLEKDGKLLGYAYGSTFRERIAYRFTVEISVYLSQDIRGNGYGRRLTEALLEALKNQGFRVAIAGITKTNESSIRHFQKAGFTTCADFPNVGYKNGEWLSVVFLSKALQPEWIANPAEPATPASERIH